MPLTLPFDAAERNGKPVVVARDPRCVMRISYQASAQRVRTLLYPHGIASHSNALFLDGAGRRAGALRGRLRVRP